MLHDQHIAPLTSYVARLRAMDRGFVPDFDPLDGGVDARVLFLFEKPGPMTAEGRRKPGSGFISRNNDDPTAAATYEFMEQANLPRRETVTWNVIPWWNEKTGTTSGELHAGLDRLSGLLDILPCLDSIVLVGRKAERARPFLEDLSRELCLICSAHPSGRVRASWPERWQAIGSIWAKAYRAPAPG